MRLQKGLRHEQTPPPRRPLRHAGRGLVYGSGGCGVRACGAGPDCGAAMNASFLLGFVSGIAFTLLLAAVIVARGR